ncbi:MAG TPA: hypothetical protein VF479_07390 [Pseudolysinimonas sp.]
MNPRKVVGVVFALLGGILVVSILGTMLVLATGNRIPAAIVPVIACAITFPLVLTFFSRRARRERASLAGSDPSALVFSFLPFQPVRDAVAELRILLEERGAIPPYGLGPSNAIVTTSGLRLAKSAATADYVTIPASAVASVTASQLTFKPTRLQTMTVPVVEIRVTTQGKSVTLPLPLSDRPLPTDRVEEQAAAVRSALGPSPAT